MSGHRTPAHRPWAWLALAAVLLGALAVGVVDDGGPRSNAERARALAETIECPQCRGQAVANSDAPAAQAIRTEISRRVTDGESDEQIRTYFARQYGEDVLLTPSSDGLTGLVWFLPVAALVAALGGLVIVFRRWRVPDDVRVDDADRVLVEQALRGDPPVHR